MRQPVVGSPTELAALLAASIADALVAAQQTYGSASLALAGGSSFNETYRLLFADPRVDWQHLRAIMGDERVTLDPGLRNAGLVFQIWQEARPGESFEWMGEYDATQPLEEQRRQLAGQYAERTAERPLDIALLGVGTDGHTASLFTHSFDRWEAGAKLAIAEPEPATPPAVPRISLAPAAFRAASELFVLAQGNPAKSEVLRSWSDHGLAAQEPIWRLLAPVQEKTTLFVERALLG